MLVVATAVWGGGSHPEVELHKCVSPWVCVAAEMSLQGVLIK